LRLIVNPRDDEAFRRIINYPARGIGDTTLTKLDEYSNQANKALFEVAANLELISIDINKGTRAKIAHFVSFIAQMHQKIHITDAYELAYEVASSTGIIKELKEDKTPESISRFENLQELLSSIKEFTTQNEIDTGPLTLENYLENVALLTDADNDKAEDADKVTLMTIHSAKGLEFKIVFIVGMEENLFPSTMSGTSVESIEEERRLFYVAITRAKEKAFLSHVETRFKWGNLTNCTPSRFISEIDEQYIELPPDTGNFFPGGDNDGPAWGKKPQFVSRLSPDLLQAQTPAFKPKKLMKMEKAEVSASPVSSAEFSDPSEIKTGMNVWHERFGDGKVIHIEGEFPNSKATVFFQNSGQKQLLLKFAKLKIIH
ncbi:MAG TPA: 3'-5' exonuclease, partial [Bacteroidales bacterium]|nr:3'-5' exonuclease [Bacteroidales bacterium]